jgi:hypothetical protein
MVAASPFPPSFDGNPWTYALALFSLTLVSALSLTQILAFYFEPKREREISRLIGNPLPRPRAFPMSALVAFRLIVVSFLVMAFCGACPDVFILLAWGEASHDTLVVLYTIDRIGDGFVMFPFLVAMWLLTRTRQPLEQQLAKAADIPLGPFNWSTMAQNMKISCIVLLIAAGVTLGKASV